MKTKKQQRRLSLGLDLSTQGLSAALLDMDTASLVYEHSLDYARDPRLNGYGIQSRDYLVPPRVAGEADQPPDLFLAALEALLGDLQHNGVEMGSISVINTSGQQHGHVYLNKQAAALFARLITNDNTNNDLVSLLRGSLAYGTAPIWMTSDTLHQAEEMRKGVGGKASMIKLSGSDVPLRFTGAVVRRVAQYYPEVYRQTAAIQLLSSYIPAVLTGRAGVPVDFGNACGMALMDYTRRKWSAPLIRAASLGLPGGSRSFRSKLPALAAPDSLAGPLAGYFVKKYGFAPDCRVAVGSGDNPQSKVLISGDLLSLGSSLVNMISTDGRTVDPQGLANAVYDGVGRPFMFACRTNGTLVWDGLRALYGLSKEDYGPAEESLRQAPLGRNHFFWQPRAESFPPSGVLGPVRIGESTPDLGSDYSGLIETTLAAVYHHSRHFALLSTAPLFVTGGAAGSPAILRRIAAIWQRPVVAVEKGGAALGAAAAGVQAYHKAEGREFDLEQFCRDLLKREVAVAPVNEDCAVFHAPGGYLDRFAAAEARLIKDYPLG